MQFPIDWYIPIVPGALYLTSIIMILTPRAKILTWIRKANEIAFIATPPFFILSFIVGTAANTLLVTYFRPAFVSIGIIEAGHPQMTSPEFSALYNAFGARTIDIYRDSYQGMVFLRSLFFSTLTLAIVGIHPLWSWFSELKIRRILAISFIAGIVFALYITWSSTRMTFLSNEFDLINSARKALNGQTQ